ncbi:TPA: polymorphic toxin type 24 domain-containing protein [Neisseria weaveri]
MSKREKRQVTKEEAEARIIRQMLRNVDEATAKADLFKRDDNIVSLMGAYLPKRDKHYQDSAYNSRYNAAYGSVLNHDARYKHFGRTPEEINSYNRHVVTDIPKAIANVGIGAYESAANLANGSVFAEDPAYARIGRIGYGIPEYGNALETVGSLGLGAYALGRGTTYPNEMGTKSSFTIGNRRYSVVDGEMAGANKPIKQNIPLLSSPNAQRIPSGNFPRENQKPNAILYRANQNGSITSYAVYDKHGMILKRVDMQGKAHAGIPTPHVIEYGRNTLPDGTVKPVTPRKSMPRPARADELYYFIKH